MKIRARNFLSKKFFKRSKESGNPLDNALKEHPPNEYLNPIEELPIEDYPIEVGAECTSEDFAKEVSYDSESELEASVGISSSSYAVDDETFDWTWFPIQSRISSAEMFSFSTRGETWDEEDDVLVNEFDKSEQTSTSVNKKVIFSGSETAAKENNFNNETTKDDTESTVLATVVVAKPVEGEQSKTAVDTDAILSASETAVDNTDINYERNKDYTETTTLVVDIPQLGESTPQNDNPTSNTGRGTIPLVFNSFTSFRRANTWSRETEKIPFNFRTQSVRAITNKDSFGIEGYESGYTGEGAASDHDSSIQQVHKIIKNKKNGKVAGFLKRKAPWLHLPVVMGKTSPPRPFAEIMGIGNAQEFENRSGAFIEDEIIKGEESFGNKFSKETVLKKHHTKNNKEFKAQLDNQKPRNSFHENLSCTLSDLLFDEREADSHRISDIESETALVCREAVENSIDEALVDNEDVGLSCQPTNDENSEVADSPHVELPTNTTLNLENSDLPAEKSNNTEGIIELYNGDSSEFSFDDQVFVDDDGAIEVLSWSESNYHAKSEYQVIEILEDLISYERDNFDSLRRHIQFLCDDSTVAINNRSPKNCDEDEIFLNAISIGLSESLSSRSLAYGDIKPMSNLGKKLRRMRSRMLIKGL